MADERLIAPVSGGDFGNFPVSRQMRLHWRLRKNLRMARSALARLQDAQDRVRSSWPENFEWHLLDAREYLESAQAIMDGPLGGWDWRTPDGVNWGDSRRDSLAELAAMRQRIRALGEHS